MPEVAAETGPDLCEVPGCPKPRGPWDCCDEHTGTAAVPRCGVWMEQSQAYCGRHAGHGRRHGARRYQSRSVLYRENDGIIDWVSIERRIDGTLPEEYKLTRTEFLIAVAVMMNCGVGGPSAFRRFGLTDPNNRTLRQVKQIAEAMKDE
jgi:hypothetical protein